MIKTKINKHEQAYFLYTMTKSFFKEADILPPDKGVQNMEPDDEGENEDVIECNISENDNGDPVKFTIEIHKGKYMESDLSKEFSIDCESIREASDDIYAVKYVILGHIYDVLCEYTGKSLPWGNLTGIRPTKLYLFNMINLQMKENGTEWPFSEKVQKMAYDYMKDTFRVCEGKGKLAMDIAIREQGIMNDLHKVDGYSIYIGIPFCPSTCLYCSFTSNPIFKYRKIVPAYLECIKKELIATMDIMKGMVLDTIYIGGGTPTSLSAEELEILLSYVDEIVPMDTVKEFTVEAGRPDSITMEKLRVLKNHGVTRISINPQTMKDETLRAIGRAHTVKQFIDAFKLAREEGFDNINADIILGLSGESEEDVQNTVDQIAELGPESLTVHSLAIKRASRLKSELDANGNKDFRGGFDFEKAMDISTKASEKMGMKPYYLYRQKDMGGNLENTGFAKDGKYGLYNILMMEEVQSIVACGAGTVSKRVYEDGLIERCDTVKDVKMYIEKIDEMIERKRQLFKD